MAWPPQRVTFSKRTISLLLKNSICWSIWHFSEWAARVCNVCFTLRNFGDNGGHNLIPISLKFNKVLNPHPTLTKLYQGPPRDSSTKKTPAMAIPIMSTLKSFGLCYEHNVQGTRGMLRLSTRSWKPSREELCANQLGFSASLIRWWWEHSPELNPMVICT